MVLMSDWMGRESLEAAKEANRAMVVAAIPGRFLVDYIPFLRYIPEWVPGAKFQKLAPQLEGSDLENDRIAFPRVEGQT